MVNWKKFVKVLVYLGMFTAIGISFKSSVLTVTPALAQEGVESNSGYDLNQLFPDLPQYTIKEGESVFASTNSIFETFDTLALAARIMPGEKIPQIPIWITVLGKGISVADCYHQTNAVRTRAYSGQGEAWWSVPTKGAIALLNTDKLSDPLLQAHCVVGTPYSETPEPSRGIQSHNSDEKWLCAHHDSYSLENGPSLAYAFAGATEQVCLDFCKGLPGCTKYMSGNSMPIDIGQLVVGEIAEDVSWTFYGEAGEVTTIEMNDYYSGIDTYVTLLGPDGQELIDSNNNGFSTNSLIADFTLPAYGNYRVVPDAHQAEYGTYTLTLTKTGTSSPESPPLINDSELTPTLTSSPTLNWTFIPGGNFTMGSSETDIQATLTECNASEGFVTGQPCQPDWFYGEMPPQTVFVGDFEITTFEITNAQYNACVAAGACQQAGRNIAADSTIGYDPGFFADDYPVVGVSWHDASAYCSWAGGRLPTEIEWEKAARGSDGRRYPWGNTFESWRANLDTGYPTGVGSYWDGASPYGVMDMAGNVFEWTTTSVADNYVLRGGGWSKYYFRGRTTDRGTQLPASYTNYDIGFRCVRANAAFDNPAVPLEPTTDMAKSASAQTSSPKKSTANQSENYSPAACPVSSGSQFELIPIVGPAADRPDYLHGDLNLSQRSYSPVDVPLTLVDISGHTDPHSPQLSALFNDNRLPVFSAAYQVHDWNWECDQHGCRIGPLSNWPATLIGLKTTPGEKIFIPGRAKSIYSHNGKDYKAVVLYAEENRITLNYTREDTVATGNTVHLENICVDPNLLHLYRSQVAENGYRNSNQLPGLTDNQAIGVALDTEIRVATRVNGMFMDPRSRKDWWKGK